jgi:type IV pilus assembly protein PilE
MKTRARRGFTLPEILVTVTVVAVLAAVVVPAVTQYVTKGDTPATEQDLNQIRNAITAYVADTRSYPADMYSLTAAPSGVTNWHGPYLGANVSGNTATGATGTGSFVSSGLGLVLGYDNHGALIDTAGFVAAHVKITRDTTCAGLWSFDKAIDGGNSTATGTSNADATGGLLTWDNTGCTTGTDAAPVATLRLLAKGS